MTSPPPPPPGPDGAVPPPPPGPHPGAPPPPGPPPVAAFAPPPGYGPVAAAATPTKGPRPRVTVGASLIVAGAVVALVGVLLPWVSGGPQAGNGFDDYFYTDDLTLYSAESPGTFPLIGAVVLAGLGITLFTAGRVLAVAIIAIVAAAIAILIGLGMIGLASNVADGDPGAGIGLGAILQPIGPVMSLAGAIAATATRRKPA